MGHPDKGQGQRGRLKRLEAFVKNEKSKIVNNTTYQSHRRRG
jgi:hypothetical protein